VSRSAIELIEKTPIHINSKYIMRVNEVIEIIERSSGTADAVCKAFTFGHIQGMKAAKAEIKSK